MTTDTPKPGPTPPIRALPAKDAGGLNDDGAEGRRRTVAMLLPYMKDAEEILTVAEWIVYGSDGDET